MKVDLSKIPEDKLIRGSRISASEVTAATGVPAKDALRYRLAQMCLREAIKQHFRRYFGERVRVKLRLNDVIILEHVGQSVESAKSFKRHLKNMAQDHLDLKAVDVDYLSPEEREEHFRELRVQEFKLRAVREAARKVDAPLTVAE